MVGDEDVHFNGITSSRDVGTIAEAVFGPLMFARS
jgi:hypothetical protein